MDAFNGKSDVAANCENSTIAVLAKQGKVNTEFEINLKNGTQHIVEVGYFIKWNDEELFIKATDLNRRSSSLLGDVATDLIAPAVTIKWEDISSIY